jgi:hypothetical protein
MERYFQESLATSEEIGFRQVTVYSLHHLGVAARRQGQVETALGLYRRSLGLAQEYNLGLDVLENLSGLAGIALERGTAAPAARLLGLASRQGLDGFGPITQVEINRDRLAAAGRLAVEEFQLEWQMGEQMTPAEGLEYFLGLA